MEPLRVLLADDHVVVREGTREMLERDPAIEVVGEAGDGDAAVRMAVELDPDVVLLDLALPAVNGIEATRRIRALANPPRVLILSAYDDDDYVLAAIDAGAGGYLLKTAGFREVIAALRAVAAGELVLHPSIARNLLDRRGERKGTRELLTDKEIQVLRLASHGLHNKEIAAALTASLRTVEAHFTSIFNKLGVSTRTEAIVHAASKGLIRIEREPPT